MFHESGLLSRISLIGKFEVAIIVLFADQSHKVSTVRNNFTNGIVVVIVKISI